MDAELRAGNSEAEAPDVVHGKVPAVCFAAVREMRHMRPWAFAFM